MFQTSLDKVESYRRHLSEHYGIFPGPPTEEAFYSQLLKPDRAELKHWKRRLQSEALTSAEVQDFYGWMAGNRDRLGIIHSWKWTEILCGGILAESVVRNLAPEGTVLDLGCNAGYWTTWASLGRPPVVGLDHSKPSIQLGKEIARSGNLEVDLLDGDFHSADFVGTFDLIVSLQGVSHDLIRKQYRILTPLAAALRTDGYALLVDNFDITNAEFHETLKSVGFSIVGIGNIGGLNSTTGWVYIPALLLRKTFAVGLPFRVIETIWNESHRQFQRYADGQEALDKKNTAYFMALSGPTLLTL